jgi:uncharacterized protein (DUF736 family)
MTKIGAAWLVTKEDGKQFISLSFDKEILPFAVTENRKINLWEIPQEKKTSDKSPDFTIDIFIPEEK